MHLLHLLQTKSMSRCIDETSVPLQSFGSILYGLPTEIKKIIRNIEKLLYKLNSVETAIIFNQCCLKESLLPKYSELRLHDPTARRDRNTRDFRRSLVSRQLQFKKREKLKISEELQVLMQKLELKEPFEDSLKPIHDALNHMKEVDYIKKERTILGKLIRLNGGKLHIPKKGNHFINLSSYKPDPTEEALLDMGLNCHYGDKIDIKKKRLEIEVLLNSIQTLEKRGDVKTSDSLKPLLLAEALTDRSTGYGCLMTKELRNASKRLKQAEGITIRKADKTASLVLLPTDDYYRKLDEILADTSKFQRIKKNPIDDIKREANNIIERINASSDSIHLPLISGDYEPGYLYGNVKTHKQGNPLRPIISQVTLPTYSLAKTMNKILAPFVPTKYCVNSSLEFLDLLRRSSKGGNIASIDAESLFTNVPVDETIEMILDRVYRDAEAPKLNIPEEALKSLLQICTKKAPFITHRNELYTQVDGVAMGSPLGPLFANFYMGVVEERVFSSIPPPPTYCRYIDDTFVAVQREEDVHHIIEEFQNHSVLRFTHENSVNGVLPYLDVLISDYHQDIKTSVYRKATNTGLCLNGISECPKRYKTSVIDTYIKRALTHCSNWQLTTEELNNVSKILVNNGYSNKDIEKRICIALNKWYAGNIPTVTTENIKLFYRAYYHKNYKKDEGALHSIIRNHVSPTDESTRIQLNIYYKNKKSSQLLLRNNPAPPPNDLKKRNVVYHFRCQEVGCSHSYIGMTTTRLSKRLSCHLQEGAIYRHYQQHHNKLLTRDIIVCSTRILQSAPDHLRLRYLEALYILDLKPSLNTTQEAFLLPTTATLTRDFVEGKSCVPLDRGPQDHAD